MTELASGRLAPLAALRLRARMARSPELAREFAETKALFTDLRELRSERPSRFAPDWLTADTETGHPLKGNASPTVWNLGGFAMNRRAVIAATATLSLLCVTGGYAAVRYLYSFDNLDAGHGRVWSADRHFTGQVKFTDADGVSRGSYGGSATPGSVTMNGKTFPKEAASPDITVTVTVDGEVFPLT